MARVVVVNQSPLKRLLLGDVHASRFSPRFSTIVSGSNACLSACSPVDQCVHLLFTFDTAIYVLRKKNIPLKVLINEFTWK